MADQLILTNIITGAIGDADGLRTFETDWFSIAASKSYTFTHGLNLERPDLCMARLVGKVEKLSEGWDPGDILFCDGQNYIGNTPNQEIGWAISLFENSALVSFGNAPYFSLSAKTGGYANPEDGTTHTPYEFSRRHESIFSIIAVS